MISLESIRAAALSDRPWDRLDEIVRAELASGRKLKEIADDFSGMINAVWETPGLSEDGHDAFGDTLDALTGNCHSDYCYRDPPNTSLPTEEEEIAKLPRRARIAFAARCARRILPLFFTSGERLLPETKAIIAYSVRFAELNAFLQDRDQKDQNLHVPSLLLQLNGIVAEATTSAVIASVKAAVGEAYRVGGAALAAPYAVMAFEAGDLRPSIRRDFDHLANLAQWHHWTDDTPVPPEVFGPLWPEGPPPGWPADPDAPQRNELPVAFLAKEGVLPVVLEDEVVNLFNALNRYYILRTGDRLTVDGDIHTLLATLNPAAVS